MERITGDSPEAKSLDITQQNIAQLKQIFPDVFSRDKIDFEVLKAVLGEEVDESEERYNFTWNGKTKSRQIAQTPSEYLGEVSDIRSEWVRRFKKFADNYFMGDMKETEYCLKDVFLLHKWEKVQQNIQSVDFVSELDEKRFTEIDTMGAIACQGGACEITF